MKVGLAKAIEDDKVHLTPDEDRDRKKTLCSLRLINYNFTLSWDVVPASRRCESCDRLYLKGA